MRRGFAILIIGVVTAVAAYSCAYYVCMTPARKLQQSDRPELAWLKDEFRLSSSEFERVSELHRAYLPECAKMCRLIAAENEKLQKLLQNQTDMSSEIEHALSRIAQLRAECQTKMLRHFFEVSRTMPPDEGKRYLQWVQEKAFASDRDMATTHAEASEGPSSLHRLNTH